MASTSIDGLISGLDTTDVIAQLMQIERQPQARLRTQRTALDTTTAAWQAVNARFAALAQAAGTLAEPGGWQAVRATTSASDRLQVVAGPGAAQGDLTVTVEQLATTHTLVSERAVAGLDAVVATGPLAITVGGQLVDPIDVGDGSLSSVVSAINAADVGVRAVAVQVSPGSYRLQLTATASGTAGTFTVDSAPLAALADPAEAPLDADAFDVLAAGADAVLRVGGPTGYPVTSSTNTFRDLLPGVDLTAVKADPATAVAIQVRADEDAVVTRVTALVDAVNGALGQLATSTAYDPVAGRKGVLLGNSLARQVQQELYGALRLDDPTRSLRDVGLRLGAEGLQLDTDALRAALRADPAAVQEAFTGAATAATDDGLAVRLAALGEGTSHPRTGTVSVAIASTADRAADLERRIAGWDVRLVAREAALRRQFSALEGALRSLQSQSTWLAGQLVGLPSWSS